MLEKSQNHGVSRVGREVTLPRATSCPQGAVPTHTLGSGQHPGGTPAAEHTAQPSRDTVLALLQLGTQVFILGPDGKPQVVTRSRLASAGAELSCHPASSRHRRAQPMFAKEIFFFQGGAATVFRCTRSTSQMKL